MFNLWQLCIEAGSAYVSTLGRKCGVRAGQADIDCGARASTGIELEMTGSLLLAP
jgi:hypothetical protein